MSYPVQPPPVAVAPPLSPGVRPLGVTIAAVVLWVMAAAGLIYAIATLLVVPGALDTFRGAAVDDPSAYTTVVWLGVGASLLVAVVLVALFLVLGVGLRRGSNAARIATLIVCGLGILGGAGSALTVTAQQAGDPVPGTLGDQLSEAYPGGWIGTNVTVAVAQIIGYILVAVLLLTAPREFFRASGPMVMMAPQSASPQPVYGMPYPGAGHPGPPSHPAPGGYGPPPGYASGPSSAPPPPGYGPPPPGYGRPPAPAHGPAGNPPPPGTPYIPSPQPGMPSESPFARPASVPPHQSFETPSSAPPSATPETQPFTGGRQTPPQPPEAPQSSGDGTTER